MVREGNLYLGNLLSNWSGKWPEAGVDEAGRGCLAGPVVAAAVVLPEDFSCPGLNDSKKLSPEAREKFAGFIKLKALAFAIGMASAAEIDQINILQATFLSMHRALDQLQVRPAFLIIDGNRFKPYPEIPHQCIVGGDGRSISIAAASVLAKTYRDALMSEIDHEYPQYAWAKNKGYPTRQHREAIAGCGLSPHHRTSFKWQEPQLSIPWAE